LSSGFEAAAAEIWRGRDIVEDFDALCACGGRFAGTPSEGQAREFLALRLAAATGGAVRREAVAYRGWDRGPARLTLGTGRHFAATGLGRSAATPAGGLRARLLDLGRGAPADFAAAAGAIAGRIVLVQHEYMLASGHIHRRRKYEMAKAAGAVGFLIAYQHPGGLLVTGSTGTGGAGEVPAAGISYETAAVLAEQPDPEVTLEVAGRFVERTAENLFADIPGRTGEWVVLSAHIDGHDLAQSAIDNASGLACALAVARALRAVVPKRRRGLRIALFNVEEWAMIGSREHLTRLSAPERSALACNVNLDSVAGASALAVMTSGIPSAEALAAAANEAHGFGLRLVRPFMGNSDHGNFIRAGIPALRLCAGFDEPSSNLRFQLTPGDTADKVHPLELKAAASVAAALTLLACEQEMTALSAADIARIVGDTSP